MINDKEQLGYNAQRAWRRLVITLALIVAAVIFAGYNPLFSNPWQTIALTALFLMLAASPVRKTVAYLKT